MKYVLDVDVGLKWVWNEALDAGSAENLSLYSVFEEIKQKGKTASTKLVPIGNVQYDNQTHTVTITLAQPVEGTVRVTVHGGVVSSNGDTSRIDFKAVVK
jgi:hypothetical protein